MSLLERLLASKSGYSGKNPKPYGGNDPNSKLHFTYSINGNPRLNGFPAPSLLSTGGKTPKKYLDNPPQ